MEASTELDIVASFYQLFSACTSGNTLLANEDTSSKN